MGYTMAEVIRFVQDNDVKFIRLAFCDIFGGQKNISIMPDTLKRAFENGLGFDASFVQGFNNVAESDLFLMPDPSTLSVLPWRPSHGRVVRLFCDIYRPDGSRFEGDGRAILKEAVRQAEDAGYACKIGTECEFYLTEYDEAGYPTDILQDKAGYCAIAPLDKGENVRREICLTLEEMGIAPERSHHGPGPGQNEIDLTYTDALTAADQFITFKSVVKTIAARDGLFASFMPKPFADQSGSGLHINLSMIKDGVNIFDNNAFESAGAGKSFIAGILDKIAQITVFLNPITNSYARFGAFEAPKYITWSRQNHSQLVRVPYARGVPGCVELRSADASCNPYLAFALLIYAGLDGIGGKLPLPAPCDLDFSSATKEALAGIATLPKNLKEALTAAESSAFVRKAVPARLLDKYIEAKREMWKSYAEAQDRAAFEHQRYFLDM